jgi:phosphate transport system substrate-binding protein
MTGDPRRWRRLGCAVALAGALLAAAWLTSGCGATVATPAPVYLRIAGSTSLLPALRELGAAYTMRHPQTTVDVQGGDSQIGLQALRAGGAEIAAVSWKAEESEAGQDDDSALLWHPVARDAVAVVVHPKNTLVSLSMERARQLFAGRYALWPEVAGKGGEIQIISREDGSGTRAAFEAGVMGDWNVTALALVMPSNDAVVSWVAGHPNAVGYVSMAYITTTLRAVRLDGVIPSARALERSLYPVARPLYLVTRRSADRAAQDFVQFCLSPAGQAIVAKYHAKAP